MKKSRKSTFTNIFLVMLLLLGLGLLLYPTFADYWNRTHFTRVIAGYQETVASMSDDDFESMWRDAMAYNAELNERQNKFAISDKLEERYNELLNIDGKGIMGYIEIENINVFLPIYHGTTDTVLQVAAGHVDWSSLPVGGAGTHCVISGHRGLPSAKLFTDLDSLREGDTFTLNVLDQVLTYEVDQIRIVLPNETDDLLAEEGRDYCTLVTCTPYGVNTHRLLIRGHRVETRFVSDVHVVSEAIIIEPLVVAPILALPLLLIMIIVMLSLPADKEETRKEKRRERRRRKKAEKAARKAAKKEAKKEAKAQKAKNRKAGPKT